MMRRQEIASGLLGLVVAAGLVAAPAAGQVLNAQQLVGGLSQPLDFVAQPGSTRMFIVEQTGAIKVYDLATGTLNPTNFIHLGPAALGGLGLTTANGEQGLLGLAFHPDFANNGFFYVSYTATGSGASVLARYRARQPYATSTSYDATVAPVILRTVSQPFANHNGGHIEFGPDGKLYWGLGDGGSANDPNELAQNINSLLGKILRLDVDNVAGSFRAVDNPAATPGSPNANWADDIWAMGLRNPWRFSFDRLTGDLWIADVGQDAFEEIDFQPALTGSNINSVGSRNYGWDCREGFVAGTPDSDCSRLGTFTDPILVEAHANGACSITGGHVYRGTAIPQLYGHFFYADYCGNFVKTARYTGSAIVNQVTWPSLATGSIVAFGEDNNGELYIVSISGSIYRIVPPACGCPCILQPSDILGFSDNFQTNLGWTTSIAGATTGGWQRGVPVNDPGWAYDPASDSDGSGSCYLTENAPGNTDVDNGSVVLTSPAFDLINLGGGRPGGDITICYNYYNYLTISSENVDGIFVDISSNGTAGPWRRVASHTTSNGLLWTAHAITQANLNAAGVTITSNMRVRFTATDAGTQSIVECGVDNFKIYRRVPIVDCNSNGIDDAIELANGTAQDCNGNSIPDICDIRSGLLEDYDGGPTGQRSAGGTFFNTSCIGCHNTNGTGGTGPNIRNKDRETIRRRLTLEIAHPGGGFPSAILQDFANLEAFLADGGSRARPDRIPDTCQTGLPDCDNDGQNDGRELQLGTQVDLGYNGIPDSCESCPADYNNDDGVDGDDVIAFFSDWDQNLPAADFNGDDGVDGDDVIAFFVRWDAGC
jgi:glucose/arabinose dehydrogenase